MNIIEKFRSQALIVKILDIAFIVSVIYEIIALNIINISLWILGLIIIIDLYSRHLKKEE